MPLVVVTRVPAVVSDDCVRAISSWLQTCVSVALNAPEDDGGDLSSDEVEIRVREPGPLDVNYLPFQIEVFANDFPSRRRNLGERTDNMVRALCQHVALPPEVLGCEKAFVWVNLVTAEFRMF